jgi:chromosome partitioning protein
VVAIASPKGGCGKTTLALNLAVSLARGGLRVVLVDADPNGDILSAIACRSRATSGVFDALSDDAEVSSLAMETAIPGLSVIPAMGDEIPASLRGVVPDGGLWRRMLEGPRQDADIVLIDAPAGMFGVAGEILDACTHVLGVLQAESIPKRSFDMFQRGLLARKHAPEVVGVVLNMFRRSHSASVSVLVEAGQELPPKWLFETTIPRNDVFMDATERGMPVILSGSSAATFVGGLFDALASEIRDRLDLAECARPAQPGAFLL